MQQVLSNNAKIGFLQLPSLRIAAFLPKSRLSKAPLVRGVHNTSALESQKPLTLRDQKYPFGEQDDFSARSRRQFFMNIRFIGVGFRAYIVKREAPQVGK